MTAPSTTVRTRSVPQTRPERRPRKGWWAPAALIAISLIPVVSGTLRLLELAGGPHLMPPNPRVAASPIPLVVHVVGAVGYSLLGAFQFSDRLRRRHLDWHRRAGRFLAPAGLAVAGSGLWMTLFYPGAPGGTLLWVIRLVVGSAMAAGIVLGVAAIRRHDIASHRAWMMRAYALGLGAGTQTFTEGIGQAFFAAGDLTKALSLGSGWALNALVAELIIRRRPTASPAARGRRSRRPAWG